SAVKNALLPNATGLSKGVRLALFQKPCKSGRPSEVRGIFGACASATTPKIRTGQYFIVLPPFTAILSLRRFCCQPPEPDGTWPRSTARASAEPCRRSDNRRGWDHSRRAVGPRNAPAPVPKKIQKPVSAPAIALRSTTPRAGKLAASSE